MVVVEPQVVEGKAEGFDAPPLEIVENGFEDGQGVENLILLAALPILIHLEKLGAFDAIVLSLIAGLALSGTIFFADIVFAKDIFHAVRSPGANTILKDVVVNA